MAIIKAYKFFFEGYSPTLSLKRSKLEVHTFPPQHGFEKSLCDHLYYHHILVAGKIGSIDSNKT